jgi:hypothetical protein
MNDLVKIPEMREPLIPLSILELDREPPTTGWAAGLAQLGIRVQVDDVGRLAIARSDARRLFTERREAEARQREAAERNDVEIEKQRVAALRPGIPASHMPFGVGPAAAMLQAGKDADRQTPSHGEWMFGDAETMVYHSYAETAFEE